MAFLPDWYTLKYDDIEDALCDYFEWVTNNEVLVCTWLPPDYYDPTSGNGTEPTLRIWRQPGRADQSLRTDEALVQIAAITRKRSDTWQLIDFVREMMDDDVIAGFPIPRKDGSVTKFRKSEEWLGPQIVPEQLYDDKFIPVTFKVPTREKRLRPNFRQILNSLPR